MPRGIPCAGALVPNQPIWPIHRYDGIYRNVTIEDYCFRGVRMQRRDQQAPLTHIRPTRLIRHPHQFLATDKWKKIEHQKDTDVAAQPTHTFNRDSIGVAERPYCATRLLGKSRLQHSYDATWNATDV